MMISFPRIDAFHLMLPEPLLPAAPTRLAPGVTAVAGRANTTDCVLSLPDFEEHLLCIHLKHRMHLDVRIDKEYTAHSAMGHITLVPRGYATDLSTY